MFSEVSIFKILTVRFRPNSRFVSIISACLRARFQREIENGCSERGPTNRSEIRKRFKLLGECRKTAENIGQNKATYQEWKTRHLTIFPQDRVILEESQITIGEDVIPEFINSSISLSPSKRSQVPRPDSPRPSAPYSPRQSASYSSQPRTSYSPRPNVPNTSNARPSPAASTSTAPDDYNLHELQTIHSETSSVMASATQHEVHNFPSVSTPPDRGESFQSFLNDADFHLDYFGQPYIDSQGTFHGRFDEEEPEKRHERARKRLF